VSAPTRVVLLRTGIVLERDGGALPRMLPPFWFGAGGPVGSGRQYWPWIHRRDWIDLVRFLIDARGAAGPFNATAPEPVPKLRSRAPWGGRSGARHSCRRRASR
jgi:NAD dependent epimerase/dehydratase family enzyme